MSIPRILLELVNEPYSPDRERDAHREITNLILNEYRMVYDPNREIYDFVQGDLTRFADQITDMPSLFDTEDTFQGIKSYLSFHIIDLIIEHEDDYYLCEWVATGLINYIGGNPIPPPVHFDDMLSDLEQYYSRDAAG